MLRYHDVSDDIETEILTCLLKNMTTPKQFAAFIRKVADGVETKEEWDRCAANHYSDEKIEASRSELVRLKLGYTTEEEKQSELNELLNSLADRLEKHEN